MREGEREKYGRGDGLAAVATDGVLLLALEDEVEAVDGDLQGIAEREQHVFVVIRVVYENISDNWETADGEEMRYWRDWRSKR